MDLSPLGEALRHDALTVVFINVLLQQIGLPVPAVPTLLLAGSLLTQGSVGLVLGGAIIASVLADCVWYGAGRLFGYRVLSGLCRLSINPASCVNQTEARFLRWGVSSLVVAKFIPGFSTVAPPIAGALRMGLPGFLLASAAGAGLWAGLALGAGWLLQDAVHSAISFLEQNTRTAAWIVGILLAGWLGWKLWNRARFRKAGRLPHITPEELAAEMARPEPPLLLDLRSAALAAEAGPIPGARPATHEQLVESVRDWPLDQPVVTLCACPEDAGAIHAAQALRAAGYRSVRPLKGGYQAWRALQGPAL